MAVTIDPVHLGPGMAADIKSDEAVYGGSPLRRLRWQFSFERRDLERFDGLFHRGPRGPSAGKRWSGGGGGFPHIHVVRRQTRATAPTGKALLYPTLRLHSCEPSA